MCSVVINHTLLDDLIQVLYSEGLARRLTKLLNETIGKMTPKDFNSALVVKQGK
jgi:hypothetical protein